MRNEDTEELRQMARCNINIGYPLSLLIPWVRASDKKYDSVTTMMTDDPNWRPNRSSVTTHETPPDDTWWPKWRQKNNPVDPDDFGWQPHMTHVTTCWWPSKISWQHLTTSYGDTYRQSWKLPVLLGRKKSGQKKTTLETISLELGISTWSSMSIK
jgi:hypothetical protein